jgi:hypothetical protein
VRVEVAEFGGGEARQRGVGVVGRNEIDLVIQVPLWWLTVATCVGVRVEGIRHRQRLGIDRSSRCGEQEADGYRCEVGVFLRVCATAALAQFLVLFSHEYCNNEQQPLRDRERMCAVNPIFFHNRVTCEIKLLMYQNCNSFFSVLLQT